MQDENDVNSEEFAEEPLAAGTLPAARSVADRSDSPRAGDAVSGETNAEPKNIDGGPGPAAAQPEVVSPEETNAPVEDAEALAAAEAVGESVAEPVQDAGEPGPAAAQPEVVSPEDTLAPDAAEHDKAPAEDAERETLSPEEILAPDAAREQPKWPAEDAELTAVLEAVIYITDEPLTLEQIATAVEQPRERIKRLLDDLVAEWQKPHHGLSIREVAGGYKMATKPEHHEAVRQFVKSLKAPIKLSLPSLETLAVIAYKQPVTAPEIMEIRGVQGAGVLKTLMDRKLIVPAGRKNVIGKPILYKTTKEFLVQFGLKDLSELPSVKEFEELTRFATSDPEPAPAAAPQAEAPQPEPPAEASAEPAEPQPVPEPGAE